MHPWLIFGSPVKRPSFVTQGWAEDRPSHVGGMHHGMDFRAAVGDPIYAVGTGLVEFARDDPESTAGRWIGIRHEGELLTRYLHLSKILVVPGQGIVKGQLIGLAGSTGLSSGPHLHLDAILPKEWLPEYTRLFGTPAGGFPKTDFGYKVPAEPLIPADGYSEEKVVAGIRRYGIPLYTEVSARQSPIRSTGGVAAAAGILALAVASVYYWKS